MERLTRRSDTGHAYYPRCFEEPCGGDGCKIKDCLFDNTICERLAKYEDTGLEPESVEALKLSMMGKAISGITEFEGLPIDRLRELAEADKDGRLVVHGRWIEDHDYLKCAECGVMVKWDFTFFDIGNWNYCPNCGAKMDGGDGDAVD